MQFRTVQKQLLVRFKESKPSSLGHTPLLLEETCVQLADLATQVEEVDKVLATAAHRLTSATFLVLVCLRCANLCVALHKRAGKSEECTPNNMTVPVSTDDEQVSTRCGL